MKGTLGLALFLFGCLLAGSPANAQQAGQQTAHPAYPANLTAALDMQLSMVEHEFEGAAEAMPEDKYSFAPTNGNFQGVRTFAQQVKHVAMANTRFFDGILGQPGPSVASPIEAENGPESIRTKAQILQFLRDSFALGHKAIASINDQNAFTPLAKPPVPFLRTPGAIAIFACAHAMDHYGQMVEYLRDNGIVPPASRQRPPANPPAR